MIEVYPILCRAGTMNNYSYLIIDKNSGVSAIIDPSETRPIIQTCEKQNIKPNYILNTHHHFDHTDSNLDIKKKYGAIVIGNKKDAHRIPEIDIAIDPQEKFQLGDSEAQIIEVDGHTIGHILWYFPEDKILFTGDMLFNLCIGGLFEGSIDQMWQSIEKIKALPEDTEFYPGHEYTMYGAEDALWFSQQSSEVLSYLDTAKKRLEQGYPVAPTKLMIEKKCNPYLAAKTKEEFTKILQR